MARSYQQARKKKQKKGNEAGETLQKEDSKNYPRRLDAKKISALLTTAGNASNSAGQGNGAGPSHTTQPGPASSEGNGVEIAVKKRINLCKACSVRVHLNDTETCTKEEYLAAYRLTDSLPPTIETDDMKLVSDQTVTLTNQLFTKPGTCCYLCAGLLHVYTLTKLAEHCAGRARRYECSGGVGLMASHVPELIFRSYLCGLGKVRPSVKVVFKWLLVDMLTDRLQLPFRLHPSNHDIVADIVIKMNEVEFKWATKPPFNWDVIHREGGYKLAELEARLGSADVEEMLAYRVMPGYNVKMSVDVMRDPIYLGGRYTKTARNISQTPWFVEDGKQFVQTSIEQVIADKLKGAFDAEAVKMHAAGREDIDVRMLGNGRPFYIQLNNVKREIRAELLSALEAEVNAQCEHVQCHGLRYIRGADTALVKDAQNDKEKEYRCIVKAESEVTAEMLKKLNGIANLLLDQKTPIRVLHRRAALMRKKRITRVEARRLTEEEEKMICGASSSTCGASSSTSPVRNDMFVARVVSESGTYIKEFVHGDFGRTLPNFGTILGNRCDMLQLDVENLDMDWPPQYQYSPWEPAEPAPPVQPGIMELAELAEPIKSEVIITAATGNNTAAHIPSKDEDTVTDTTMDTASTVKCEPASHSKEDNAESKLEDSSMTENMANAANI